MTKMMWPKYILEILHTFNKKGYEAYVVGGCVRDSLLEIPCHDYDIATNATPYQTMELFEKVIPTGLQHGTVTVLSTTPVEITTFRKESQYTDHRHPQEVSFVKTIEEDLSRRDFTINAMAYHPDRGYIDPFGGKEDLKNKVVRCVGDPNIRFQEDALRMMRAYRFCAKLNFQLDMSVKQAIERNKQYLKYVSIERIRSELTRTMEANPFEVENMVDLLEPWIPELKESHLCSQHTKYHFCDVLHHSLYAITLLENFDETLAYALLLHDLGKPSVKTVDPDGVDHFKGHASVSCAIAQRVCRDFKFTHYQRKWIPLYIENHEDWFEPNLKTIYKYRIEMAWPHEQLMELLEMKKADVLAHSQLGQKSIVQIQQFIDLYNDCIQNRPLSLKDLKINGKDIIEHTSLKGKDIQEALKACLNICFFEPEKNNKEYLLNRIASL